MLCGVAHVWHETIQNTTQHHVTQHNSDSQIHQRLIGRHIELSHPIVELGGLIHAFRTALLQLAGKDDGKGDEIGLQTAVALVRVEVMLKGSQRHLILTTSRAGCEEGIDGDEVGALELLEGIESALDVAVLTADGDEGRHDLVVVGRDDGLIDELLHQGLGLRDTRRIVTTEGIDEDGDGDGVGSHAVLHHAIQVDDGVVDGRLRQSARVFGMPCSLAGLRVQ
mmetsp:Transcript_11289/g.31241  ORF Transcript_11289/g.31241 Transcript_11289/m.31241 type:complete len:224 (-) Transcript_11289:14-685(-)